jgi:NAD(P)-dependent dehydrogenase (short-subunit alcohol dehydrogenase family)
MANELRGKRVIITGGTGGLGSAVVRAFAGAGAICEVTTRQSETSTSDAIRYQVVDVGNEKAVAELYAKVADVWASIHLVGGFDMAPIADTTLDQFRRMFEINAVTCFLCCREAAKTMRKSRGGRIVNVAARPAVSPTGGMIAYSASKAAVASITQSLAEEVKGDGILINAVLPSIMDTPANRKAMPKADFAKWPKVEEVARAILFLASDDNALTSGALLPVYGKM